MPVKRTTLRGVCRELRVIVFPFPRSRGTSRFRLVGNTLLCKIRHAIYCVDTIVKHKRERFISSVHDTDAIVAENEAKRFGGLFANRPNRPCPE